MVVVYFGPPEPLRGLPTLLRAFALAYPQERRLKLLALSRPRDGHPAGLDRVLRALGIQQVTRLVDRSMEPEQLARHVAAGDLVALPFELVLRRPAQPAGSPGAGPAAGHYPGCLPARAGLRRGLLPG
jgi:hypothetical protein